MNPISAFLVKNIVGVYFFYGLAFFAMGMALALVSRRTSEFKFARAIPPLAGFGLVHGLHEWYEMFQRIAAISSGHVSGLLEETVRVILLVASFLLLVAFGILLLRPNSRGRFGLALPLLSMAAVWSVSTWIAASIFNSPAEEVLLLADVLSRYCLGIPGALIGAWALMAQQRTFREHAMPQFGRDLVWCAAAATTSIPMMSDSGMPSKAMPSQMESAALPFLLCSSTASLMSSSVTATETRSNFPTTSASHFWASSSGTASFFERSRILSLTIPRKTFWRSGELFIR